MIILHADGQTCNKFFTYFNYLADSIEKNEKIVILSPDVTLRDYPKFKNCELIKLPFYFESVSRIMGYHFNIKMLQVLFSNRYSVKLFSGLFKFIPSIKYIKAPTGSHKSYFTTKHNEKLKRVFTPDDLIRTEVNSFFQKMRATHDLVCGVHIRHGDYRHWNRGKYFYTEDQYYSMMLKVKKIFREQSVAFFISSNEKIDLNRFKKCDCYTLPNGSATKDLCGLSICDYIIGPPSTFSGWASFIGDTPLYFIENPEKEITKLSFKDISDIWK